MRRKNSLKDLFKRHPFFKADTVFESQIRHALFKFRLITAGESSLFRTAEWAIFIRRRILDRRPRVQKKMFASLGGTVALLMPQPSTLMIGRVVAKSVWSRQPITARRRLEDLRAESVWPAHHTIPTLC